MKSMAKSYFQIKACIWTVTANYKPDTTLYDLPLARKLALKLWSSTNNNFGMIIDHQGYCGHGLAWKNKKLIIAKVYDGCFPMSDPLMTWSENEKTAFVNWFAVQSDFSLSGYDNTQGSFYTSELFYLGNQRITRDRVERFINNSE